MLIVLFVALAFLPAIVYLLFATFVFVLWIAFFNSKIVLSNPLKFLLIFVFLNILSVAPRAIAADFIAVAGLIYLLPFIGAITVYVLCQRLSDKNLRLLVCSIYLVALIAGIHAVFFAQSYDALGRVNTPLIQFKRNSLYSDIESTALATGIAFLFLMQLCTGVFVISKLADFFVTVAIVLSTVSKSIMLFYPFLIFVFMDYRTVGGVIFASISGLGFMVLIPRIFSTLYDYFANNGLSSFLGRTEKWQVIFEQKTGFGDLFFGEGMRYVNIQGPFAGPHSLFVGLLAELGWLAFPAFLCLLASIYFTFGKNRFAVCAIGLFCLTAISSEIIYNRYFLSCLMLCMGVIWSRQKSKENNAY